MSEKGREIIWINWGRSNHWIMNILQNHSNIQPNKCFRFTDTYIWVDTCILRHSFKCYGRCLMVQKPLKSLIGHLLFRIKCYFRLRILRSQVKQHMWPTKRYIELLASTLMCLDISWGISLCYKLLSKLCWSPAQIMFSKKNFLYSEIFMEAFIHC